MSGHSHAKTIKHQKGLADAKRSAAFSKAAKELEIAAKEGGDPVFNSKLRMAIEKAKEVNMPADNIERAVKRGTGELEGGKLEEVSFEAYGPGNVAIIIDGITDNKNRTLGEIKQILNQNNGKLVGEGAIRWMFDRKGTLVISMGLQNENFRNKENMELAAIEAGAEDIYWHADGSMLDIYTKPEDLEKVRKSLEEKGIKADSTSLGWVPKENIKVGDKDKEACQKLFEALDESDAAQEVYSNIED
ncbi:MAG: YebC/PmpR family DNA-binding transcriptional regulator [Candidatus Nealsonbacteria bacterium]|nr:YebC/PmpR family DNA-binding transcriptional regulator [Candidatus Nealsonbacteria bacterium]